MQKTQDGFASAYGSATFPLKSDAQNRCPGCNSIMEVQEKDGRRYLKCPADHCGYETLIG